MQHGAPRRLLLGSCGRLSWQIPAADARFVSHVAGEGSRHAYRQHVVVGALGFVLPRAAEAQRPAPSVLWQKPPIKQGTPEGVMVSGGSAPDHRWEGLAIGAGVGALAFG